MANIHKRGWKTEDELGYLSKIGQSHVEVKRRASVITLLQNYIASAERRKNWDGVNKKEVIERAKQLLTKHETKQTERGKQ